MNAQDYDAWRTRVPDEDYSPAIHYVEGQIADEIEGRPALIGFVPANTQAQRTTGSPAVSTKEIQ